MEKIQVNTFKKNIRIDLYGCDCGKYREIKYRGCVCERCGIEVKDRQISIPRDVWNSADFKEDEKQKEDEKTKTIITSKGKVKIVIY